MNMEEEKQLSNKYTIIIMVVIFLIALLIAGGTYAFMVYDMSISNKNIASSTVCFDIVYDADNDTSPITGTLIPSSGPGGGLSGKISIGMNSNCNINVYGNFYLNITNGSDVLFQTVDAHCENSQTLRTLVDYKDQASCEAQTNGKWVTDGTALKYAIYTTNNITASTVPVKVDYIDSIGEKNIYKDFSMTNVTVDYYVYVWLDGNLIDNEYANQSLAGDISASVSQVESGGVSGYTETILNGADPVLDSGMIPVTISDTGVVTTADTSSQWYSYSNKQWANAILVKENATADVEGSCSREYYKNNPGTPVLESDILAYYVWVPRYKYKLWTVNPSETTSPQTIDIVFEGASSSVTQGSKVDDYITHPAFIWDGTPIAGFWVGKFETSHSSLVGTGSNALACTTTSCANADGLVILPNVVPFQSNKLFNIFYGAKFMTSSGNSFGFSTSLDNHLMKNDEWGAVAYLSHSMYGKNGEIEGNYYTITGKGTATDSIYGSLTSYPQSTTGNITGVFDMSGGVYDIVMGNFGDRISSAGFTSMPDLKYYNYYSPTQFTSDYLGNKSLCTLDTCGGHALYETAGWYSDSYGFVSGETYTWFLRGRRHEYEELIGIFAYDRFEGRGSANVGFHVVAINL